LSRFSVVLRKCPHYGSLTKKLVSQQQTFFQSLLHIMAGKQLARLWYEEITLPSLVDVPSITPWTY